MLPTQFPETNLILQCPEGWDNCVPLPVRLTPSGLVVSRWQFTEGEFEQLEKQAHLWLVVHSDQVKPTIMVNPSSPFAGIHKAPPPIIGVRQEKPKPLEVPKTKVTACYRLDGYTIYKVKFSGRALVKTRQLGALWVALVCNHYPAISLELDYPFNRPERDLGLLKLELP